MTLLKAKVAGDSSKFHYKLKADRTENTVF